MAIDNPNPGQPVNRQVDRPYGVFATTKLGPRLPPNTNVISSGNPVDNLGYTFVGANTSRTDVRDISTSSNPRRWNNGIVTYTNASPTGVITRSTQRYDGYAPASGVNYLRNTSSGEAIHSFYTSVGNTAFFNRGNFPTPIQVEALIGPRTTDWMSPTIAWQSGAIAWGNIASGIGGNLQLNALDQQNVQVTWNASSSTFNMNWIFVHGFNFNLPAHAVINGCEFRVNAYYEGNDATNQPIIQMNGVRLSQNFDQNGANTNNTTAFPNIASGDARPTTYNTYGSATHKGNLTLTPTIVNGSGFGYSFRINKNANAGNQTGTLKVDHAQMRIYYTG